MEAMIQKIESHVKTLQDALNQQTTKVSELEKERNIALADIQKINGAIVAYQDSVNLMKAEVKTVETPKEPEVVEGEVV